MHHELIHVISGVGVLATRAETFMLESGGTALIRSGELYYFEGNELQIFMACTPAWSADQHKIVE